MAPARARKTSSFTWYGDADTSLRGPAPQWPDLESSNGSSADDASDVLRQVKYRGTPAVRASYESDMSDVGECDDRKRFRDSLVKVSYDSDSCLTPRSRRTLRRTLSGAAEPWPSVKAPAKPALDTIFSPTHEILHPLQSLRLERSSSNRSLVGSNAELPGRITARTSVTFASFTLPKPQSNSSKFDSYIKPSPKPSLNPSEFYSCSKPSAKPQHEDNSSEFDSYIKLPSANAQHDEDASEFYSYIKLPSAKPQHEDDSSEFDSAYIKLPPAKAPQHKDSSEFDNSVKASASLQLSSSGFDRCAKPSPKPRFTPVKFESYTFPEHRRNSMELNSYTPPKPQLDSVDFESYRFSKPQPSVAVSLTEEKLEQKQSLIRSNSGAVKEEVKSEADLAPNVVVIIVDAEKKLTFVALDWAINVAVRPGDEIILLGVLKHILSPMGYKLLANTDPLYGVNREVLQSEINRTAETFQSKLSDSGRIEECEKKKVKLTVRIAPGARVRTVVVRELAALGATYAIFDRRAMRSRRYYGKHLSCHAVRMRKNGRSTKTITLVPPKSRSQGSDISSVSSMSTDRTSSESASPTFWRRITSFRSSRRSSPRISSAGSHRSDDVSPSPVTPNDPDAVMPETQDLDALAKKLKLFQLAEAPKPDGYSYKGMDLSHRKNLPPMSVTIPPPICAA